MKSWLLGVAHAVLLLGIAAWSLHAAAAPRSLRFERLGVEQGLSQESVHTVRQDRDGYIWIGSQAGLNRYDGYKVKVFRNDPADPSSLVDNFVMASYEDDQGRMWFGTKGGLTRFDSATQTFLRYPAPTTALQTNQLVLAIVGDRSGGLWLGTADGLKHFDPLTGRYRNWRHDPDDPFSLADDRVNALALDPQGNLWVGTADGLDQLAPGARNFTHYRIGVLAAERKRNHVVALSMGPRATLWIGTDAGLEHWRLGGGAPERHRLTAAEGIGAGRIRALYHDSGDNLWVGTDTEGLKWRDPSSGQFVTYARQALDRHSLSDSQVTSVLVDRTGTLWVGTVWGGVNRSDLASGGFNRLNQNPDVKDGLQSDKIRVITGDGAGKLWIGTTGGGLSHIDPRSGRGASFRRDDKRPGSLPEDSVAGLVRDGARLWVGSPTGVSWSDGDSGVFHPMSLGPDANSNHVQEMILGRDKTLWIVTRGGLHALAPDRKARRTWRHDPHDPDSLAENYGFTLLEDRAGMLWVGTDNGLDRFDRASGAFTHFRHDPRDPGSLAHSRVYDLYQTADGAVWAGTAGGLSRIDVAPDGAVRFRTFPITAGNAPGPVGAILEDARGILWLATTVGLTRLDPATGSFKNYSARDGLIDGSYFVGSAWRADDGTLYFGGVNGMTSFTPLDIRDNPFPPKVVLTDFSVANRPRALDPGNGPPQVTLAPRDSVFSIEFAALHYADPSSNSYAYRLRGFDPDWVRTDASRRFASYTNLDPGSYVFEVKAANKDGVWSAQPATLAVTVTPPIWKTWWLRTLAALLLITLGLLAYHLRIRALVQQKTHLEREVNARTGELVKQKESAEARKREVEQQKEVVEVAHRNISLLSEIGRDLTTNLHSETIMATLYNHVNELMDASVFGIGVYRPEKGEIDMPFAMERGVRYRPYVRKMSEPNQLGVWCIEHRREVFINDLQQQYGDFIDNLDLTDGRGRIGRLEDGTLPATAHSLMYVPIMAGERVLGVITVHSYVTNAYQRIHLDMLRTLAAYVGVAFDNADAYRRLTETQTQLAAHEKLASLGSLVAGVAHELNTPIGNSLLLASTMQHQTDRVAAGFGAGTLRRSELVTFIDAARDGAQLIMRSLHQAADLVNSFKQVAVDQASAQRRPFDLAQASLEIAATMMNQVRLAGHSLVLTIPAGISMDSYPGPLGQVLINFISNALLHGFSAPGGAMRLSASTPEPGRVLIVFSDNGVGIAPEHQARIFDPFFTTRMGQGGSGLGLHIAYNIVTSLLNGAIRVDSTPGAGTRFTLDVPLRLSTEVTHKRTN
ncbi:sensor histidine kinase [Massilia sp. S19_KUP03_FR1]|uniref:sensor histidine kinase n=1 Tax=Massilia sp. S19_KUP03_FR1 TaxID=3025503 RepID=UPI002FCD754D